VDANRLGEKLILRAKAAQDAADFEALEPIARALIELHTTSSNAAALSMAYRYLGNARHYHNDARGAHTAYARALEIAQNAGEEFQAALAMIALGNYALEQNSDFEEGRRLHEAAEPAVRASRDLGQLGILTGNLAEIARVEGEYDQALRYARESFELFERVGDPHRAAWPLITIALVHALKHDFPPALDVLRQAWKTLQSGPNAYWTAMYFDVGFMIATKLRRWETAAQLLGFGDRYRDEQRVPRLMGLMNAWYAPCLERLMLRSGYEQTNRARMRGAQLAIEQAQKLVEDLSGSAPLR
jgi:tetratricopeptide (TPR) repeat protein